jgi:hypothetical protein
MPPNGTGAEDDSGSDVESDQEPIVATTRSDELVDLQIFQETALLGSLEQKFQVEGVGPLGIVGTELSGDFGKVGV